MKKISMCVTMIIVAAVLWTVIIPMVAKASARSMAHECRQNLRTIREDLCCWMEDWSRYTYQKSMSLSDLQKQAKYEISKHHCPCGGTYKLVIVNEEFDIVCSIGKNTNGDPQSVHDISYMEPLEK